MIESYFIREFPFVACYTERLIPSLSEVKRSVNSILEGRIETFNPGIAGGFQVER